jgi:hypothetical protein
VPVLFDCFEQESNSYSDYRDSKLSSPGFCFHILSLTFIFVLYSSLPPKKYVSNLYSPCGNHNLIFSTWYNASTSALGLFWRIGTR